MALVRHAALDIHSLDGRIGSDLISESLPLDSVQEVCGADMYSPNGVGTVTGAWAVIVSLQEVCPNVVGTVMGAWSFPYLVGNRVPLLVMLLRPSASRCSKVF